jgi:ATP-dependent Lhr-like helicase
MTEADRLFARFPDFIKEYIYRQGWSGFRDVQMAAARVLFETEDNLLLSSSTASGKTEAAFFPILTELTTARELTPGVSVLYIAPLKSLINDQFQRMEELLDASGIPVFHWHGDVGASHKTKLLKDPKGILQITPESLESMMMNRSNDIPRIFAGLRYIVIDEIHTMIGSDRGNQVICLLTRMARLLGFSPRRIGLSATVGDMALAAEWLGAGSGRNTAAPVPERQKLHWRLGMEHFYFQDPNRDQSSGIATAKADKGGYAEIDPGYEFLYDSVRDKKALVFSNSREETEYVTATLRQIARNRREKDVFLIHHGNLSAALREDAEMKMKDEEVVRAVTCATVTMELGIDIGRLERVAQMDSPNSVSSFLQRLGRSGRRDLPPEMILVFREESPLPNTPLPQLIPWELLRAIAIVQLYVEDRFIEPPRKKKLPLSLAFHQTLSILFSSGELTAKALAERVLSLPPLSGISREAYRELLVSMINDEYIEMTEEKGLIIGLRGERLIGSFKFYAVFKDSEDFTVRCGSDEIGTITTPPPVGDRFALAGRVWEVLEVDVPRHLIFVRSVDGKMEISWPGDSGEIHTRILERMRRILLEDRDYPYLLPNARSRLMTARRLAKRTGMGESMLIHIGGSSWCLFPWLGTRAFRTVRRYLAAHAGQYGLSDLSSEGCCYMTFKLKDSRGEQLLSHIASDIRSGGIDAAALVGEGECPVFEKYDDRIPSHLLREAYAVDRLSPQEMKWRFFEPNVFSEIPDEGSDRGDV